MSYVRIINRKNYIPILCYTYTFLSLLNIVLEIIFKKHIDWSQANNLQIFGISAIAIFLLSQQYRLARLPLLVSGIIQYVIFISIVMGYVWVGSYFMELAPHGYRDMWISCTIFYGIGVVTYYIEAFQSVRRQNNMLNEIKDQRIQLEEKATQAKKSDEID